MSTSQFSDPAFLREAYGTEDGLTIRIEAHRHYQIAERNVFEELTRDALAIRIPRTVLDIGAGTGAWYPWIRQQAAAQTQYTALEHSDAMMQVLEKLTHDDPAGHVYQGDAESLPFVPESFDWVGLHFMLYHVPHIDVAIGEAWRVLRPGGVLIAATNGAPNYPEMMAMHREACRQQGIPYTDNDARGDRFSLTNGAEFFPGTPRRVVISGGLRFPTVATFLAYYGSGFCWAGVPLAYHRPNVHQRLLDHVGRAAEALIQDTGGIFLSQSSGYFVQAKDRS